MGTLTQPLAFVRTVAIRAFYRQIPNPKYTSDAPVPDRRDAALGPDLVAELNESTARVRQLLEQLSITLRLPFALHLDGADVPEIAKTLGKTEDTVRRNLSRARAAVKKQITSKGGAR
jgi:RNA polymerase sigma factor (sigma-70 family)